MATVWERGPYQFCARVRRNGVSETRTFETRKQAERWAAFIEGKVAGDEYDDRREARDTSLSQACDWMAQHLDRSRSDAKNKLSKLRYWQGTHLAGWSLLGIRPADLIDWRRMVLDEDGADDGTVCGPDAECGPQTVIHRLNVLSQIYKRWSLDHDILITNPVVEGVRPSLPGGRDRRLAEDEEDRLLDAADKSSRPWLRHAIVIAIETCMRQAELSGLTWRRTRLDGEFPYVDLPKTKNDRPRRVPLSIRAVEAIQSLRAMGLGALDADARLLPVETPRGIAHAFAAITGNDAFPDLRWHDLRHEGISRLFELTDLRDNEIMAITGHLRPEMLTRYTHLRADRLGAHLPGGRLNTRAGRR
ncbi:MAG: site-specific integrase [Bacteroidota bacterium]